PGRQFERQRASVAVAEEVDFRRETASRATQGMVVRLGWIFFFPPPPAHRAARTMVPSMHHRFMSRFPRSTSTARNRFTMASRVPSEFHLSNRSQAVLHDPYSSGTSRQGAP